MDSMRAVLVPWLLVTVLVTGAWTQPHSGDGEDQAFPSYGEPLVPLVERSEGGLRPLYLFARSFLRAVQPNAFPGGKGSYWSTGRVPTGAQAGFLLEHSQGSYR